jgi:hypothetical protein
MGKKVKVILSLSLLILIANFLKISLKDDMTEIEKAVHKINHHVMHIEHVKLLDHNQAIVFFEHTTANKENFGNIRLKKNIFGWKPLSSSSAQTPDDHKLGWHFSNLSYDFKEYTDVLSGKIFDSRIDDVHIVTKNNKEYKATIVTTDNGERFWYLITDGEPLPGSTVTGVSQDGDTIEEINL